MYIPSRLSRKQSNIISITIQSPRYQLPKIYPFPCFKSAVNEVNNLFNKNIFPSNPLISMQIPETLLIRLFQFHWFSVNLWLMGLGDWVVADYTSSPHSSTYLTKMSFVSLTIRSLIHSLQNARLTYMRLHGWITFSFNRWVSPVLCVESICYHFRISLTVFTTQNRTRFGALLLLANAFRSPISVGMHFSWMGRCCAWPVRATKDFRCCYQFATPIQISYNLSSMWLKWSVVAQMPAVVELKSG